ncbi:hypothetical protein [Amycolatopsis anabasis]|uniref:hypothetical protein n=1 Tax=Amycolatopsis anabasis TaxID=1840409 RepID=UPI00131D7399|nr:hypothetical protein [Amycolatopsis anabasis]
MKRIVAAAGAFAAGLALVLSAPVTAVATASPQNTVTEELCEKGGGDAEESEESPTGRLCVGGVFSGIPVSDESGD